MLTTHVQVDRKRVYLISVHSFQVTFQVRKLVIGNRRMLVRRTVDEEVPERVPNQRHGTGYVKHQRPVVVGDLEQVPGRTLGDNRSDHVS